MGFRCLSPDPGFDAFQGVVGVLKALRERSLFGLKKGENAKAFLLAYSRGISLLHVSRVLHLFNDFSMSPKDVIFDE